MSTKTVIPVFYASDENYLPYLAVSLASLKENASKEYAYEIYILHAGIDMSKTDKVMKFAEEDFGIHFVDVSEQMENVKNALQLRDYYTGATYYRIFIANMFPQYERALYIDSDTIVLGDISKFCTVELGDNLIAAVPDGAVASVPAFRLYTKEVLGIDSKEYFNAGVILMNLDAFREFDFYGKFCDLLKKYKFRVAQDQDYLNVLCHKRTLLLGMEWNRMPIGGQTDEKPELIHYNLTLKPWHYDNILFQEYFWEYANKSEYCDVITAALKNYTEANKENDAICEKKLVEMAIAEAQREDNYFKVFGNK